ncbi:MAG TPA: preprotein translocase subunit YajC [Methylocystis sp.]|nr:preprotein translocase subunit YajC [Methylocystis sp.]
MNLIPQAMAQTEQAPAPSTESAAPSPAPVPAPAPDSAAPAPAPATEAPTTAAAPAAPKTAAPTPAPNGKISIAPAAPAQQPSGSDALVDQFQIMAPFLIIIAIVYFVVLRPQQRAQKAAASALRNVRRGDVVATSGGLIGKVSRAVDDNEVEVELAPNLRVRLLRSAITEVRAKSEPVKDAPAKS